MKKLFYLFLALSGNIAAQGTYNFENGMPHDWIQTNPPRWEIISDTSISGSKLLHHGFDNPVSGVDCIGFITEYPIYSNPIWFEFSVRHGYAPSAGNNWQFFMAGSTWDMNNTEYQSGYFVGVNLDGSDDLVELWEVNDGEMQLICSSGFNFQEEIGPDSMLRIRVERIPEGNWHIYRVNADDYQSNVRIASGKESQMIRGKYAGFRYKYTSAQDRKLWIDDVCYQGKFIADKDPPEVISCKPEGLKSLFLEFDEAISYRRYFFKWDNLNPDSVKSHGNRLILYFKKEFPNRIEQHLQINGVTDLEGNMMTDTVIDFEMQIANYGDVVIHEIMADPDPEVYLPPIEYIELFNRSEISIDLSGWTISVNERKHALGNMTLGPGDYALITSKRGIELYDSLVVNEVFEASNALPNTGASLILFDNFNRMVHRVDYRALDYYGDPDAEGGRSLECIDPNQICSGFYNWTISEGGKGGTPGALNSRMNNIKDEDDKTPVLTYTGVDSGQFIKVAFDEFIYFDKKSSIKAMLGSDSLIVINNYGPYAGLYLNLFSKIDLTPNRIYNLHIENIQDCEGNILDDIDMKISLPHIPEKNQLLINELMYDPEDESFEYIEILNPGNSWFDLKDLQFEASGRNETGSKQYIFSAGSYLIAPGDIIVMCRHRPYFMDAWNLENDVKVLELEGFRSLPNSGGKITIYDRSGTEIDKLVYSDTLHHDLLGITTGVALERIHSRPCVDCTQCWTSASSASHYGTPGRKNSQFLGNTITVHEDITLKPEVISPDGDGYEDIMEIMLPKVTRDALVEVYISDLQGLLIKDFSRWGIPGESDMFYWDGRDNQGRIVRSGLYVVQVVSIEKDKRHTFRKACAVSYR